MSPLDTLTPRRDMPRDDADSASPREPGATSLAIPVHACVPGRIRWHVRGLRGDPALKAVLEGGLRELPGIYAVSASTDTGNLLTHFDPAVAPEQVSERVIALVRGDAARPVARHEQPQPIVLFGRVAPSLRFERHSAQMIASPSPRGLRPGAPRWNNLGRF